MLKKTLACSAFILFTILNSWCISLPSIISDHMVVQNNAEVTLWGWGKAREPIEISVSWDTSQHYKSVIAPNGKWSINVKTSDKKGPHTITFKGYNTIQVKDVLLGEVWLCTGQSNMEWSANSKIEGAEESIASANFPEIRLFIVSHKTSEYPQDDCQGAWMVCTPETMANFSAIGYFFGKEVHQKLNKPMGLIQSAWGGTPAETWTPKEIFDNDYILNQAAMSLTDVPWGPIKAGSAYNAMIHPLLKYKIAGALWYQGEGNVTNANTYGRLLGGMIEGWRAAWRNNFPFFVVQIAPYKGYGNDNMNGAIVRFEQAKVPDLIKNTYCVVVSDIGNLDDIHPKNKIDVGKRLSNLALAEVYHANPINSFSPRYLRHDFRSGEATVFFSGAENGLISKGDITADFELQDQHGKWHKVGTALIEGNKVKLKATGVDKIINLRFAFKNDSVPLLCNKEGLPASCFTTENY